ncbi:MAG: cytochrome c3 family protein, partial [Thermodesulfobacteriota bacterium]
AHSDWVKGNCSTCHHYDRDEEEKENCRECHESNDIPIMHAYHEKGEDSLDDDTYQSCMSCHEERGKDPKNCRGCHK